MRSNPRERKMLVGVRKKRKALNIKSQTINAGEIFTSEKTFELQVVRVMEDASRESRHEKEQTKSEMKRGVRNMKEQNRDYLIRFYHFNEHKPKSKVTDKKFFNSVLSSVPKLTNMWAEKRKSLKKELKVGRKINGYVVNTFNLCFQIILKYLLLASCIPSCILIQ